jgi:adenylate kinase family enzyme
MQSTGATDGKMRRVLVIGCSGAGKSTFARRLAAVLALPVVHLDRCYWRPQWQMPGKQQWRAVVAELAAAPEWIMDGNYSSTFDLRMPRADTVIWLDFSRVICMRRVLWRTFKGYGRTRPDLPEDCREHFDLKFFRYVWNFHARNRPHVVEGLKTYGAGLRVFQLTSDREAENFLSQVGRA